VHRQGRHERHLLACFDAETVLVGYPKTHLEIDLFPVGLAFRRVSSCGS
jgi:hypothetical protein